MCFFSSPICYFIQRCCIPGNGKAPFCSRVFFNRWEIKFFNIILDFFGTDWGLIWMYTSSFCTEAIHISLSLSFCLLYLSILVKFLGALIKRKLYLQVGWKKAARFWPLCWWKVFTDESLVGLKHSCIDITKCKEKDERCIK